MKSRNILNTFTGIDNLIEIGEEITRDLDSLSSVLRESVDSFDYFVENNHYTCNTLNKPMLDYISKKINLSQENISKFEDELELLSNYDRSEDVLDLNDDILEKLNVTDEMNVFLRIQLEEYLIKLESVKEIVEDIVLNLNKQQTDPFLANKFLM